MGGGGPEREQHELPRVVPWLVAVQPQEAPQQGTPPPEGGAAAEAASSAASSAASAAALTSKTTARQQFSGCSLAQFHEHYQLCRRCAADLYRRDAASESDSGPGRRFVVVRKIPDSFEGGRARACAHFQWVWCPGIPGNDKCGGSTRHNTCPKYLAGSTFWKHKLPKALRRGVKVEASVRVMSESVETERCVAR